MAQQFFNNASSTLAAELSSSGTSLVLQSGGGSLFGPLSGGNFGVITVTDGTLYEIIKYTAVSGDTLTIERAQEGTPARTWSVGSLVEGRITAGMLSGFGGGGGGLTNNATGTNALALGSGATAEGTEAIIVGVGSSASGANTVGLGSGVSLSVDYGIAMGYGSSVYAGTEGIAIGPYAFTGGDGGVALGRSAGAVANKSTALGYQAMAQTERTLCFGGAPILQATRGGTPDPMVHYSGAECIIMSDNIDLKGTPADDIFALTLPDTCRFYVDEVGIIIVTYWNVAAEASVSFGVTGSSEGLVATTALNAPARFARHRFTSVLNTNGIASLTCSLKSAGAGDYYLGRAYFKGLLVEHI